MLVLINISPFNFTFQLSRRVGVWLDAVRLTQTDVALDGSSPQIVERDLISPPTSVGNAVLLANTGAEEKNVGVAEEFEILRHTTNTTGFLHSLEQSFCVDSLGCRAHAKFCGGGGPTCRREQAG